VDGGELVGQTSARDGWLQVSQAASAPPDGSDVGAVIRWYRMREGLTQQDAAVKLRTTQSRLSKLEKGSQALRDVAELRHIAITLGIPPERLGVLPDHSQDAIPRSALVSDKPGKVRDSQEQWRAIRRSEQCFTNFRQTTESLPTPCRTEQ